MEERIIRSLSCLEDQSEISEKEKKIYIPQILNQEFYMGLLKSITH